MFVRQRRQSGLSRAIGLAEVMYHATVRGVRGRHGSALISLLMSVLQTVILVGAFWLMISLMGIRSFAIRGDFVLYLFSGIFLFMTHTNASSAVFSAEGPTSAMMLHSPMNTIVAIVAAAVGSLYIQVLSMIVVLYGYHAIFKPITIDEPVGAFAMVLLSWFSGVAVGMVILPLKPWFPSVASMANMIWSRANMLASGKMFVANTLTFTMLRLFDWNPLFHLIDQARGFTFITYNPRYTSISYPVYVTITLLVIGLMGEFYTRRAASISWGAKR